MRGTALALLAALSFGATVPLVQRHGRGLSPFVVAALLYGGAALASLPLRPRGHAARRAEARLSSADAPRLFCVALLGAVLAPVALAVGVERTDGATASLLLNLEAVFTVLAAAAFHREPIGRRVGAAVLAMVLGGALLVLPAWGRGATSTVGALAVTAASLAWALDNTFTRPLADRDPRAVVLAKASIGALASAVLAVATSATPPSRRDALALLLVGGTGYGLSLRLYLLAQRTLGAARTGSVFAVAPFVGAALAFALGGATPSGLHALAGLLFAAGVALHLGEDHAHAHDHPAVRHEHAHRHDDGHHDHAHDPPVSGAHSHVHDHAALSHVHAHAPDLHHRHSHE